MTGHRSFDLLCDVWWAPAVQDPDRLVHLLDGPDPARYRAFRFVADRARFLTGRLLARQALAAVLGVDPAAIRLEVRCAVCGGPHGKPAVVGASVPVDFSIAHAGEHVIVATAVGAQVGVDVERVGRIGGLDGPEAGVLSAQERSTLDALEVEDRPQGFFRLWTRKEAVLKATGEGLAVPMAALGVAGPGSPPEVVAWPDGLPPRPVRMRDLDAGDGYAACLAVLTSQPLAVTEHPVGELAPR